MAGPEPAPGVKLTFLSRSVCPCYDGDSDRLNLVRHTGRVGGQSRYNFYFSDSLSGNIRYNKSVMRSFGERAEEAAQIRGKTTLTSKLYRVNYTRIFIEITIEFVSQKKV